MADIKSLEHPTLKVPYELLNKKFRAAQKNIDREISHVVNSTTDLEKCLQKSGITVGEVASALSGLEEKLSLLKRKAEVSLGDEAEAAHSCKRRIEHLKEAESPVPAAAHAQWKKKRLDRMLVEYFLRAGYYETARRLADHSDIRELTNIELFEISKDVEDSLQNHETAKCLSWCHDNRSKLRKMKSCLEFHLRQQEYIELVRTNKRLDAVKHARKYLTSGAVLADDTQTADVGRVMALLAFPPDTDVSPYKELLSPCRWTLLVEEFRQENFKLYQLNHLSVFTVTLQAGMSALKTPQCYRGAGAAGVNPAALLRNPDCPVCSTHINQLALRLPYAHCANSRLICHISGAPMNEHNPPMMLPNGYVYGLGSLTKMAEENEGKVVCPRTKVIYNLEDAEKVFVM